MILEGQNRKVISKGKNTLGQGKSKDSREEVHRKEKAGLAGFLYFSSIS